MSTYITISTGINYSPYLTAASAKLPDRVVATTPLPEDVNEDATIQSRFMKTNFAKYLPEDAVGPVVLLDADVTISDAFNPAVFDTAKFDVQATSWLGDMRYIHWPPAIASLGLPSEGFFFTTGLVVFKTVDTAKTLSALWRAKYAQLLPMTRDVFSFNLVLRSSGLTYNILPNMFNSPKQQGSLIWHDTMGQLMGGKSQFKR